MLFETIILLGLLSLVVLTVGTVIEAVEDFFPTASSLEIVDPGTSFELERIAREKSSGKRHKRFAYDRSSGRSVLVESNRIADELKNADVVTVDIR